MDALSISLQALYSDAFSNLIQLVALIMGFIGVLAGFNLYYQNKNNDKALERKLNELKEFYHEEVSALTRNHNDMIQSIKDEQAAKDDRVNMVLQSLEFEVENAQALGFHLQARALSNKIKALKSSVRGVKIFLTSSLPTPNNEAKETREKNIRAMLNQIHLILNYMLSSPKSEDRNPIMIYNTLKDVLEIIKEQTEYAEQYKKIKSVIEKIESHS